MGTMLNGWEMERGGSFTTSLQSMQPPCNYGKHRTATSSAERMHEFGCLTVAEKQV